MCASPLAALHLVMSDWSCLASSGRTGTRHLETKKHTNFDFVLCTAHVSLTLQILEILGKRLELFSRRLRRQKVDKLIRSYSWERSVQCSSTHANDDDNDDHHYHHRCLPDARTIQTQRCRTVPTYKPEEI